MSDVRWIKIVTDIFDDEKILLIETLPEADSIIVIWFKLLCLAGKQNNSGVFVMGGIPYTEKMLSTIFRRKETVVQLALKTFENFGMIEIIDNTITIPNWGKHQNFDKIELKTEYMRNYMREYRDKQKQIACKSNSKSNSKANVSSADKIREDKIREDKESNSDDKSSQTHKFIVPSLDDVKAYCADRNNNVDPERFIDFYESKGWMIGKNKMKNWKAAVRTWEDKSITQKEKLVQVKSEIEIIPR